MNYAQIDYIFPFVVFGYGAIMTVIFSSPKLLAWGRVHIPDELWTQFQLHQRVGLVCLFVGGVWSLQNLLV